MAAATARESSRRRGHRGGKKRSARKVAEASGSAGQFVDYARQQVGHAAGRARDRVIDRLDDHRDALSSALDDAARGLEKAGRRTQSSISRELLMAGDHVLREASSRIDAHSVESALEAAGEALRKRPAWAVAGLFGVGILAGRAVRAAADSKARD